VPEARVKEKEKRKCGFRRINNEYLSIFIGKIFGQSRKIN
jgi:hypothetical protein